MLIKSTKQWGHLNAEEKLFNQFSDFFFFISEVYQDINGYNTCINKCKVQRNATTELNYVDPDHLSPISHLFCIYTNS